VTVLRGRVLDRLELGGEVAHALEPRVDRLAVDGGLLAHRLELQLGRQRRLGRHLDGRRERERRPLDERRVVVDLRPRDGLEPLLVEGAAVPALEVRPQRLLDHGVAAEPLPQHVRRHLALAEAGDLRPGREVAERVLEGVVDVVDRNLDTDPDVAVGEALDGGLHRRTAYPSGHFIDYGARAWGSGVRVDVPLPA
jgi:hypothetical protein